MSAAPSFKYYRFFAKLTAFTVLLVVLAGSLVKVTGSGMGCPDWPKCFGHLIPPFEANEVAWQGDKDFFKGQMIIHENQLYSAKNNFKSNTSFNANNWEIYTKHSYTEYNPVHTIIEYVNRLATVVLGLIVLCLLFFAFKLRKHSFLPFIFSTSIFILILFEAWLGRLVVDSELAPVKISIHLYAALLIVALIGFMLALTSSKPWKFTPTTVPKTKKIILIVWLPLLLLCIQIFFGTKLREVFDVFEKQNLFIRKYWIVEAGWQFLVHRSFSLLYLAGFIYCGVKLKNWFVYPIFKNNYILLGSIICLNVLSGVLMAEFAVPEFLQPTHVVFSGMLILTQSYFSLKSTLSLNP